MLYLVNYSDIYFFVLFLLLVTWGVMLSKEMQLHFGVLFVFSFWFSSFVRCASTRELRVDGYSMHPTLLPGCLIRVVRYELYSCVFSLKVGDVVSFFPDEKMNEICGYDPNDDVPFVKRITGIDESGMLFVEGDARRGTRFSSSDSNDFGLVDRNSVIGVWIGR